MNNINETLELFSRTPFFYLYDREDKLSEVFSLMAFDEAQLGNFEHFSTIINHPRFTDYCSSHLFNRFFQKPYRDIFKHPHLPDSKSIETNLIKAFSIFLKSNKISFFNLYKEHRREFYYVTNPEYTEENLNLNIIEQLVDYVLYNKIFICALGNDLEQILFFEDLDIPTKLKEKIKRYNEISILDRNIDDVISYYSSIIIDIDDSFGTSTVFSDKNKQGFFNKMITIGLHFDKHKVIGERDTSYTEGNVHYGSSKPYFKHIPNIFNNPYHNFKNCINILSNAMEIDFSEEEKNLMIEEYHNAHKRYYKYS